MDNKDDFRENSQAVQAHLNISQSIILRMASNSASCKAYCITLVSAILLLSADKWKPGYSCIASVPTILFFMLDTYYLALERMFRASYDAFISRLHDGTVAAPDLFAVKPTGRLCTSMLASATSFSIWPFYLTLVSLELITQLLIARYVIV